MFSFSKARLRRVEYLQFGVISPDEIKEMSVTQKHSFTSGQTVESGITRYCNCPRRLPDC